MDADRIDTLEGRELDVAVAEAKGAIVKPDIYSGDLVMASGQDIFDASMKGGYWQWNGEKQSGKVTFCFPLPKWHCDIAAAWELEESLTPEERRRYADALLAMIPPYCFVRYAEIWALIHATPTQRCRAYLKAKESRDGH